MEDLPPLLPLLKKIIQQEGPLPLSRFMEICLYHPTYGYYIHHSPIGASHDFITAPEISQLFGEMIGVFFVDLWGKMGCPSYFSLVEFGPGKGTLLTDILRVFQKVSASPTLYLLETNKLLQQSQQDTLSPFRTLCHWFSSLEELFSHLPSHPIFFLGNEFLDTFPIDQYIFQEGQWWKKGVTMRKAGLEYTWIPAHVMPNSFLHLRQNKKILNPVQDGTFLIEHSEKQFQFLETLCTFQKDHQESFSLFIDYGYTKGHGDTFQALKNHAFIDPLKHPGTCDLTAHVNFDTLSSFCHQKGLHTYGPTSQEVFLRSLGINVRADALIHHNPSHTKSVQEDLFRLTDSSQMGTLFKVWGVSPLSFSVPGF